MKNLITISLIALALVDCKEKRKLEPWRSKMADVEYNFGIPDSVLVVPGGELWNSTFWYYVRDSSIFIFENEFLESIYLRDSVRAYLNRGGKIPVFRK